MNKGRRFFVVRAGNLFYFIRVSSQQPPVELVVANFRCKNSSGFTAPHHNDVQYHTAWSNECIEFWFLLHFAYYTANNHRTEYISFLNDKFRELGTGKYQKNMSDIFTVLMKYGNLNLAIRYAKRIINDGAGKTPTEIAPGTKVYELVEELAKYLPEQAF